MRKLLQRVTAKDQVPQLREVVWQRSILPEETLTRKIGHLTATALADWTLVFDVCDRASANDANAMEAVNALRRELKYGEPAAQLAAARLWAIMLRNSSDTFISKSTSFEDLLSSTRTSLVVRDEIVAAAAYASGSNIDFRGLWRRVKPRDDPEEDVPINVPVAPIVTYQDASAITGGGGSSSRSRSPARAPNIVRDQLPQLRIHGEFELTRKIGFLTATASEDWTLISDVCDRASANDVNAMEAVRALRREFKYGEPAAQLAAARLWVIMLRNSSETFISKSASRKFLDTLEDLLSSTRTSPVVRERVMEAVAAAAYASGSNVGIWGLWRRVKPIDKPEEGVPFPIEDAMFKPPLSGVRRVPIYDYDNTINVPVAPIVTYQDASDITGGGGSSSRSRSPSPACAPLQHTLPNRPQKVDIFPLTQPKQSLAPPAAPWAPLALRKFSRTPPHPDAGASTELVNELGAMHTHEQAVTNGNSFDVNGRASIDERREAYSADDMDERAMQPSAKALGKRKVVAGPLDHGQSGDEMSMNVEDSLDDRLTDFDDEDSPLGFRHRSVQHYVYDAVAEQMQQRLRDGHQPQLQFYQAGDPGIVPFYAPGHINSLLASWARRRLLVSQATPSFELREALEDLDVQIPTYLTRILESRDARHAVVALQGRDAHSFLDAVQDVLDRGSLPDAKYNAMARRLRRTLVEASDQLPAALFISGVSDPDQHPTFRGGFGDVYRASFAGKRVALKRIRTFTADSIANQIRLKFCREALVWQGLQHRFILPLLGIDRDTFTPSFCMVSPWMKYGTVLKYLADRGREDVSRLLHEIAQGLDYLHSMDIVHGDLRGTNILISDDYSACLSDFGLTSTIGDGAEDTTAGALTSSNHAGSVRWFAPELIHPTAFGCQRFARTRETDVYAFGCVCLELHTGSPPFADVTPDTAAMFRVIQGERPQRPVNMTDTVWDVVTAAWASDFRLRPKVPEIIRTFGS